MQYIHMYIQWNLYITETLGSDIFDCFLLQYRGFPLSEINNILVTPADTKFIVLIMKVLSIVALIWRIC